MGYSWTNIIAGATKIKGSHMQEIVDNIKDAETQLELTAPEKHTWTANMDPFSKTFINSSEWFELRTATDNLDDKNYCRTHNATHYNGYDNNLHGNYHGTHYPGYDSNLHSTYRSSHLTGYFSGVQTGYNAAYVATQNNTLWSSERNGAGSCHNY